MNSRCNWKTVRITCRRFAKGARVSGAWASRNVPDLRERPRLVLLQLPVVNNDLVVRRGFFFFFWRGMQDLTSPTRGQTWAHGSESAQS